MKKILLFALLLVCIALPAMAENRIFDGANLFTDAQEQALEEKIAAIREKYQMDAAIVTNWYLGNKSPKLFAADYYEDQGLGMGENQDGFLFLISLGERDYCTVTHGDAIRVFTDWGLDEIHAQVQPYLSEAEYYTAMDLYLGYAERFIIQAENGDPYDVDNKVRLHSPFESAGALLPFIMIGAAVIALIVVLVFKAQMKTVRRQAAAASYVEAGSFKLSRRQDIYLYTTVIRRKIESSSGSGGGGRGGSSTFRSSSGGSFGGRSGKF